MAYLGGTTPSAAYSELFVPLLQDHTNLMYGDFRGLFNNQSAVQGSFGGGYRRLIGDAVILGGYGFYDAFNSEQHNRFQQASAGVELMAWAWETRSNIYIPTSGNSGSAGGAGTASIQNGLFYLNGSRQTALSGVDAEFGMLIAADPVAQSELRAFAGGYHFNGTNGGQDVNGVSGRLEARLYDLGFLGQGSRLELGVLSSYDDVHRLQVTGLLNLRIALGRSNCPRPPSPIERRMLDRIVRRFELQTTNESSSTELATTTINGKTTSNVVLVHPGDDLQAKLASAPATSVIIVEGGGSAFSIPGGITLNMGQALVGGGTPLTLVGTGSGHTGQLIAPGTTPTIDDPNALDKAVTLNSMSSIIGVNLSGGDTAIVSNGTNNVLISSVNISNTGCDALVCTNVTQLVLNNVTIVNSGTMGPMMSGTQVYAASLQNVSDSKIFNLTITPGQGSALLFASGTNDTVSGLKVNAATVNTDAVIFQSMTNSLFSNVDIRNSPFNGITLTNSTGLSFDGIVMKNIAGDGIEAVNSQNIALLNLNLDTIGTNGLLLANDSNISLNNSMFTNANTVIDFVPSVSNISGSGNIAIGQTTFFTGTTVSGQFQFTTPNATAP